MKSDTQTAAEPAARAAIARAALSEQFNDDGGAREGAPIPEGGAGVSPGSALAPPSLEEQYTLDDAREDTTAIAAFFYRVPKLLSLPKDPSRALAQADASAQRAGRRLGGRAARSIPNWLGLLAAVADGGVSWLDEEIARRCEERDRKAVDKGET